MKILFLSDTHNQLACIQDLDLPYLDVICHSGDFTNIGEFIEVEAFTHRLLSMKAKNYVIIPGNHELGFEENKNEWRTYFAEKGITYLQDEEVIISGLKFYGVPWQRAFFDWEFNLPDGSDELKSKFDNIPNDVDILLTHAPPYGILDQVSKHKEHLGERFLLNKLETLKNLKINAFGHIHESGGIYRENKKSPWFINASMMDNFQLPSPRRIYIAHIDEDAKNHEEQLKNCWVESFDEHNLEFYNSF